MTKRELVRIAKVMYDLQEYCKSVNNVSSCDGCNFVVDENEGYCKLADDDYNVPCSWGITKTDIERLEYEAFGYDKSCEHALKEMYEQLKCMNN